MGGYEEPLKGAIRKISDNIVTVSTPFTILGFVHLGARMALFKYGDNVVIWSAIPYGPLFEEALELLSDGEPVNIAYVIVPNTAHYLCAHEYKLKYPHVKIIAPEFTNLKENIQVDYKVDSSIGSRIIGKEILQANLNIDDDYLLDNFNFVYMPKHTFNELVVYEKNSKTLFAADLIIDSGKPNLEQYCAKTGYSDGHCPHTGFSYFARYLSVDNFIGRLIMKLLVNKSFTLDRQALISINFLPFERIVPSHGNIIDTNAKEIYQDVFQIEQQNI